MKFRPNFLKRTKDVFLVAKNFGRTLYWEPFSRFFILSVKRKNPKGALRFFVLTGIFFILQTPFCVLRVQHQRCGCAPAYMPA